MGPWQRARVLKHVSRSRRITGQYATSQARRTYCSWPVRRTDRSGGSCTCSPNAARPSNMLHRVHAAGFAAVCLTVDFPASGLRHRDTRNDFDMPIGLPQDELTFFAPTSRGAISRGSATPPRCRFSSRGIMTAEDARIGARGGSRRDRRLQPRWATARHGPRSDRGAPRDRRSGGRARSRARRRRVPAGNGHRQGARTGARPPCWSDARRAGVSRWPERRGWSTSYGILRAELENTMILAGTRSVADITRAHVERA